MKVCGKCGRLLALDQFALKSAARGTRQSQCRKCQSDYSRAHHKRYGGRFQATRVANRNRYIDRARRHVQTYLETHACVDCGERDTTVLEFDHVGGRKRMAVAVLVYRGPSIASLDAEIAKCVVRCANCHRRKTLGDNHWRGPKVTHLVETKSERACPASSMVEHPAFNRRVRGPIPRRGKEIPDGGLALRRVCAHCRISKPLIEFCKLAYRGGATDCYCLDCRRDYNKIYHEVCAVKHRLAVASNKRRRKASIRKRLKVYLSAHPCVDCGESDARVLEFDHVRGSKRCDVGELVANAARWDRITVEIEKCDVRCANCHRRRTARQFGWHTGRD
jgi:hypothetical protein